MNTSADFHAELELLVLRAEEECRAGRWGTGFWLYIESIKRSLAARKSETFVGSTAFSGAESLILERVVELAVLLGHTLPANHILTALLSAYRRADNHFAAACTTLKLFHLAISKGDRKTVDTVLGELSAFVGPFDEIPFADPELSRWENGGHWRRSLSETERPYFFAQLYLEASRLFLWIGQYGDGSAAARRGLTHSTYESAKHFATPLHLELAAAALERGHAAAGKKLLDNLLSELSIAEHPGFMVRALELQAQHRVMIGNFGEALDLLSAVMKRCQSAGLLRAEAAASLNVAQLFIVLNQTVRAENILKAARETALKLGDESNALRADGLLQLVRERRGSAQSGLLIAPPVTNFWRNFSTATPETDVFRPLLVAFAQNSSAGFIDRFNDYALAYQ